MWLLFLCLAAVCAQETEDKEAVVSTTIKPQVRIEEMLPITKPSISEFAMKEVPPNTTEPNPKKSDFRASPQLETYIEYNRFPVKPVWPQPKQIKTFQQIQNEIRPNPTIPTKYLSVSSTLAPTKHNAEEKQSYYQNKPIRSDSDLDPLKFYDKYNFPGHQIPFYPTESPISGLDWANSAVYTKPIVEQPYAFVNHEEHKKEEYISPGSLSIEEEYDLSRPKKTPWKKIVKFLATVIPIGLLLSALTPNILHIGPPINTTQYCRKDGARVELGHEIKIPQKLEDECSAKEICESFLKGKTPDFQYVRNIISQELNEKNDKSLVDIIMKAVHHKKCEMIPCTKNNKD